MATVGANFCEEIVQAREKQFGSTGSKSCSSPPSNPKPASAAACTASSNQGIDKSKFIEARNAWCGDTSKRLDQSKDYAKYFEFELKKKEGGMCDKQDCIDTVNAMWNKC